jgi:hypothetical protein
LSRLPFVLALLAVSGCTAWPQGSYVNLPDDTAATALSQPLIDGVTRVVQTGETVHLEPATPGDDVLTAIVKSDLQRQGITIVDTNATHNVQYDAFPLDGSEILRLCIDGTRGGAQIFSRDPTGKLAPSGPFMEVAP